MGASIWNTNLRKMTNKEFMSADFDNDGLPNKDDPYPFNPVPKKKIDFAWSNKADTPIIDYPESYGYVTEKKMMSPQDFIDETRKEAILRILKKGKGHDKSEDWIFESPEKYEQVIIDKKTVDKLKPLIKSKTSKVPIVWLEYDNEGMIVNHEGRHRAVASRDLGIKKIPVKILRKKVDLAKKSCLEERAYNAGKGYGKRVNKDIKKGDIMDLDLEIISPETGVPYADY
jgi:hypothetical protein